MYLQVWGDLAREDELIEMTTCSAVRASVPLVRASAFSACPGVRHEFSGWRIRYPAQPCEIGRLSGHRYRL